MRYFSFRSLPNRRLFWHRTHRSSREDKSVFSSKCILLYYFRTITQSHIVYAMLNSNKIILIKQNFNFSLIPIIINLIFRVLRCNDFSSILTNSCYTIFRTIPPYILYYFTIHYTILFYNKWIV